MKCFMCSASIPDGVSTCPECGARIVSGGAKETEKSWKELVNSSKMDEDEKSYISRAYGPISNLTICKIVMAVLNTIALGVMFYLVIAVLGAVNGYYGSGVDGVKSFYDVFSTIATIIGVIISIFILINYVHLSDFEERFGIVFKLAIAAVAIGLINNFISNSVVILLLKICKAVVEIIYMYHFYGAMADITCPFSESLSDKWDLVFKIFIVGTIISAIVALYSFFAINAWNLDAYMVSLLVIAIIEYILMIIELIFLRKTVKLFENIE
ncbi:MAG: hypothetical protein K5795_08060 [Lachnospiraceae bacterium]|nr:hypothetical protein [Lachnospiraceae bacterium]